MDGVDFFQSMLYFYSIKIRFKNFHMKILNFKLAVTEWTVAKTKLINVNEWNNDKKTCKQKRRKNSFRMM